MLFHKPVDYEELKAFGCLAFASNPVHNSDKFIPRGVPSVFLGYPSTQKGFRLLNLINKEIFVSRDVIFNDAIFPFNANQNETYMHPLPVSVPASGPHMFDDDMICAEDNEDDGNEGADNDVPLYEENESAPTSPTILRRSTRQSKQPVWMQDYVGQAAGGAHAVTSHLVEPQFYCFLSALVPTVDPITFSQAIKQPHWIAAMNAELDALESNATWDIVTLPLNQYAIGSKWLYKTKYNPYGTVERYKSRLVILGNKQVYGINFSETFAPVAKLTTVRALLAVAAMQNWMVCQMDVSNAFLNGDLDELVYMKMPPGYTGMGSRISAATSVQSLGNKDIKVCRLKKALYGLRQAPRQWFSKLSITLKSMDYKQSKAYYSLFSYTRNNNITVVLVYVDDILISGDSQGDIAALKQLLCQNFHMKDMGTPRYFLGLEIDRSNAGFFVSQKKYTIDLLKEFGMQNVTPLKLPMDAHLKLTPDKGDSLSDPTIYQRLVGKLIYLTITRPDISFHVHILTQFMQKPTSVHLQAAKRLLRYLAGNPGQGILLASSSAAQLTAYCDSDWASCPITRKSTSGFCVLLGSSPLSWKTKK